jgi:hypothetical protein
MTVRHKEHSAAVQPVAEPLLSGPWLTPAWTMQERVHRIEGLGQKIAGYIDFMCQIARVEGVSEEAKERAVAAFYDRMVLVEKQLGKLQEDLRLR